MSNTDVQRFEEDGTWVKPAAAVQVDITVTGGVGGKTLNGILTSSGGGISIDLERIGIKGTMASGSADEVIRRSFDAADVDDEILVSIGTPGGYAEFITYLEG